MIATNRPVKVLLVEGDPRSRGELRGFLNSMAGYEVQTINDPYHLLAVCESAPRFPTLVLLDMEWNRAEGTDLVREVRLRAAWISILGMTWRQAGLYGHPIIRRESIGLVPRPLYPHQLLRSLRATLAADAWLPHGHPTSPRLRDLVSIHTSGSLA